MQESAKLCKSINSLREFAKVVSPIIEKGNHALEIRCLSEIWRLDVEENGSQEQSNTSEKEKRCRKKIKKNIKKEAERRTRKRRKNNCFDIF